MSKPKESGRLKKIAAKQQRQESKQIIQKQESEIYFPQPDAVMDIRLLSKKNKK